MKIDVFSHFCPKVYKDALQNIKAANKIAYELRLIDGCSTLYDLDKRFRILDKFECTQVLNMVSPPIEDIAADVREASELARLANDAMAEAIYEYPQYFLAGVAALPLNDMDAAMTELHRAVGELKFKGIQIHTSIMGKPLDSPEFFPIYEAMEALNLPIWMHPWRTVRQPDYAGEPESKFKIWSTFGWPYETSAAMTRLIFGGVFEKFPNLKILTHHAGGMIPFFAERIRSGFDLWEMRTPLQPMKDLTRAPMDYYRLFYNDTAIAGQPSALKCAYDFFGADHLLFGTDMPMDSQNGYRLVRDIIQAIEDMDIPESDRKKIFEDNARRLIRLTVQQDPTPNSTQEFILSPTAMVAEAANASGRFPGNP